MHSEFIAEPIMNLVEITRNDGQTGQCPIVDIRFKKINIVSTKMEKVPPALGRANAQIGNAAKTRAGS
ncbi:hypothetical protein A936_04721 [Enterobacter sp. Ag1]|nr:hypothetical protein A936_04721 [Enterobacter sp. Ag1]